MNERPKLIEPVKRFSGELHHLKDNIAHCNSSYTSTTWNYTINENWAEDFFGNDYKTVLPIFELFINDILPQVDELEDVMKQSGITAVQNRAHKLNPAFKMMGHSSLAEALAELEFHCAAEQNVDVIQDKIKAIQAITQKVKPFIKNQYYTISKLAII